APCRARCAGRCSSAGQRSAALAEIDDRATRKDPAGATRRTTGRGRLHPCGVRHHGTRRKLMNSQFLLPAFDNPARASQLSFRAALNALAEPGLNQTLPSVQPIAGLASATYALCLSLLDADTPVWLAPAFDSPVLRANLAFHCGCPFVERREEAAFAVLDASELSDLRGFDAGSERYPD